MKTLTRAHGSTLRIGKRKLARPICDRRPMHLILRSESAKGPYSLLRHRKKVDHLTRFFAKRFRIRVMEFANAGNHLHVLVKAATAEGLRNYLRALAGALALAVTGAGKGRPLKRRFWDHLAFSRIVQDWKENLRRVTRYIIRNRLEAEGRIPYDRSRPLEVLAPWLNCEE